MQHQLVQLKAHLYLHLAAVFEGRVLDGGVLMVGFFSIAESIGILYNASSRSCKSVSDEQKLPKNEGSNS